MDNQDNYNDFCVTYTNERRRHWDTVALSPPVSRGREAYHRILRNIYQHIVPQNARVLELGTSTGDLLASLGTDHGVGVDLSSEMVAQAKARHPRLTFVHADVHDIPLHTTFDYIILSDLLDDLRDAQLVIREVRRLSHNGTRVIINVWSRLWQFPLDMLRKMGLAQPLLEQNWFAPNDVMNLLALEGFETIRHFSEILIPLNVPVLSTLCNRYLAKLPFFNMFCLTNFIIARPLPAISERGEKASVSVVVPARNEAGHIEDIIARTPKLGAGTELIFVEGNSTDDTWGVIQREVARHPHRNIKMLQQPGKGKGDAVRAGFAVASGDVLMILDADLTVPPENLILFYDALISGRCEFVNGVRLVYPMESGAMRFCNLVANKGFSLIFSWILGMPIKDTLCGTKVLSRKNYENIAKCRNYFGEFDPFGDFDLLFGAAKQNLKIMDLPIRYRERAYGQTNISRWRHGVILLRMVLFAANRIKFV